MFGRYSAFSVSTVVGPVTLTFDLLTLQRVHGSPRSWASIVPNMGFRGLLVLDLGRGTGQTDRRTDKQTDDGHQPTPTNSFPRLRIVIYIWRVIKFLIRIRINAPSLGGRGNNK